MYHVRLSCIRDETRDPKLDPPSLNMSYSIRRKLAIEQVDLRKLITVAPSMWSSNVASIDLWDQSIS